MHFFFFFYHDNMICNFDRIIWSLCHIHTEFHLSTPKPVPGKEASLIRMRHVPAFSLVKVMGQLRDCVMALINRIL